MFGRHRESHPDLQGGRDMALLMVTKRHQPRAGARPDTEVAFPSRWWILSPLLWSFFFLSFFFFLLLFSLFLSLLFSSSFSSGAARWASPTGVSRRRCSARCSRARRPHPSARVRRLRRWTSAAERARIQERLPSPSPHEDLASYLNVNPRVCCSTPGAPAVAVMRDLRRRCSFYGNGARQEISADLERGKTPSCVTRKSRAA